MTLLYNLRDSYFVIEGLLYSELDGIAKGMIENFLDFVETYGFLRMWKEPHSCNFSTCITAANFMLNF